TYAAAACVFAPGPDPSVTYSPLSHLVLFVQPYPHSNETYIVDLGFGGSGPLRPILFSDGEEHPEDVVWGSLPPERHRIVRAAYPSSSIETSEGSGIAPLRDWHMQVTHTPLSAVRAEWTTLYTFSEAEFFQTDINAASFEVSARPSIFQANVICMREFEVNLEDIRSQSVYDPERDKEELKVFESESAKGTRWVGKWTLGDRGTTVTRKIGAKTFDAKVLRNEAERVRVLRDVFRIELHE
ncbi:hypothetical protein EW146_g2217, partial [Bondarzewia mesenterica]